MEKEITEMINKINHEKLFIHSKIDYWLDRVKTELNSSNEIRKKNKELIDLGKFIHCYNHNIMIVDGLCERPDFLISLYDEEIGIELTDLVIRKKEKEKEGLLSKIFTQIEIELRAEPINHNGLYRVNFVNEISFENKNQIKIKDEILNIIKGSTDSREFIKEIRKTDHTDISIYHSEATVVGSLDRIMVENEINKKEKKIAAYSSNKFKKIWLLLVIGGLQASDDYSFIQEQVKNVPFETNFDKIFLLNFFNSDICELMTIR